MNSATSVKAASLLACSILLAACGGGSDENSSSTPTILNGSFETGDYNPWVLSDDFTPPHPLSGLWALLPAGQTYFGAGGVAMFDHQDGATENVTCSREFYDIPTSIVSDGMLAGLSMQGSPARRSMAQDITVKASDSALLWETAYDIESPGAMNDTSQYIALNIIDPTTKNIIATPFKLGAGVPTEQLAYATHSVDLTPYRGQTIRIELEIMPQIYCMPVFFDNFRVQ